MGTKRLFIAIQFTKDLSQALEPWVKKIRKTADQKEITLKWVPPMNYHVTLVFLGNKADEEVPSLIEKMRAVALHHSPFSLKIRNISGFPTLHQARVIYLGVQRSQAILDLQTELENEILAPEKSERDYTPHMTLARLRNPKSCRDLLSPFEHLDLGKQEVGSLTLFNSVLSHGYPVYEPLAHVPLGAVEGLEEQGS